MSPCVVLALKLGAMDPRRSRGCSPDGVANCRMNNGEAVGKARFSLIGVGMTVENGREASRGARRENATAILSLGDSGEVWERLSENFGKESKHVDEF